MMTLAAHIINIINENDIRWHRIKRLQGHLTVSDSVTVQTDISKVILSVFFYQSTVLSSHAVNGHQMYFGGSVVGKSSTISIEISPTPPLIFIGVKMCEIWLRI